MALKHFVWLVFYRAPSQPQMLALNIYDPQTTLWQQLKGKHLPNNGQFQLSLNKLLQINQTVDHSDRVPIAI